MRWFVLLLFLGVASSSVEAAVFRSGTHSGIRWISVSGEIVENDDKTFLEIVGDEPNVAVFLTSPGGLVTAGLAIGDTVNKRRYATVVPPNATCASVCGAIWLGGARRFLGQQSHVGFHAAYTQTGDVVEVSPTANAWLGAYFNQIGLSRNTIGYLVQAGPKDMKWLTAEDARANDIDYVFVPKDRVASTEIPFEGASAPSTSSVVSTKRPTEQAILTSPEAAGAARLVRRFNARYKIGGMAAVDESITACYDVVSGIDRSDKERRWNAAVYCAALDVLAMIVDGKQAEISRLSPTARNDRPAVVARTDRIASILKADASVLRERGALVAAVAASKIDTTEDPQAPVEVASNDNVVIEHRSASSGHRRPRAETGCSSVAHNLGQIDSGLGNFVRSVFCTGGR